MVKKRFLFGAIIFAALLISLEWWLFGRTTPPPVPASPSASNVVAATGTAISTSTAIAPVITTTTVATSAPSTPPPQSPAKVGHIFGIAAGGGLSKLNPNALDLTLNKMVELGATWVRFDIEWGNVQYGSPTKFNWKDYDALVNALAAHHLRGLGVIAYTPQWARDPQCVNGIECPPADPSTFATFAGEVVARYKDKGMNAWEVWNEPNNFNFWAPKTDCTAYTALLKATYTSIKRANPAANVITGGLAPESTDDVNTSPTDFLSCVYRNGGQNFFDAVGDHPYTFPDFPSNDGTGAWNQMYRTTPSLRSIMVANGDAKKTIWLTEFGVPTNGPDANWYVSESEQTQMAIDAIQSFRSYSWTGPLFWYTFNDGSDSTSTNENFFGLVRHDGSTKPAFTTIQSMISAGQ